MKPAEVAKPQAWIILDLPYDSHIKQVSIIFVVVIAA